MINRRTISATLSGDTKLILGAGELRVPMGRASTVGISAELVSGTWVDIAVKRVIGAAAPAAFAPAVSLVTGTRQVTLAAADLVGIDALHLSMSAYSAGTGHAAKVEITIQEEADA